MKEPDWKVLGWKVTKKLVYYALVLIVLSIMAMVTVALLNVANSFVFALGLVMGAFTGGAFITFLMREILSVVNNQIEKDYENDKNNK